jgi:hypothetical protein
VVVKRLDRNRKEPLEKSDCILVFFGSVACYRTTCPQCGETTLLSKDEETLCCSVPIDVQVVGSLRGSAREPQRSPISNGQKKRALDAQDHRCGYCGSDLDSRLQWNYKYDQYIDAPIHYDHFNPWHYSGDNSESNIIASCSICNRIKHSKIFGSLSAARRFIREKREKKGYENEDISDIKFL